MNERNSPKKTQTKKITKKLKKNNFFLSFSKGLSYSRSGESRCSCGLRREEHLSWAGRCSATNRPLPTIIKVKCDFNGTIVEGRSVKVVKCAAPALSVEFDLKADGMEGGSFWHVRMNRSNIRRKGSKFYNIIQSIAVDLCHYNPWMFAGVPSVVKPFILMLNPVTYATWPFGRKFWCWTTSLLHTMLLSQLKSARTSGTSISLIAITVELRDTGWYTIISMLHTSPWVATMPGRLQSP